MAKEKKESAPKRKVTKTTKVADLKLMQYNGMQMSRKMWKLWNIDKVLGK